MSRDLRLSYVFTLSLLGGCGSQPSTPAPSSAPASSPQAPPAGQDDANAADEAFPIPAARAAAALSKLVQSDATGCAPGARCLRVSNDGRPDAAGTFVAQCRGEFADFIVPSATIPAGYKGPWFTPNLIEQAHTAIPGRHETVAPIRSAGAEPASGVCPGAQKLRVLECTSSKLAATTKGRERLHRSDRRHSA